MLDIAKSYLLSSESFRRNTFLKSEHGSILSENGISSEKNLISMSNKINKDLLNTFSVPLLCIIYYSYYEHSMASILEPILWNKIQTHE